VPLGKRALVSVPIRLSPAAIESLKWWRDNLQEWNGKLLLPREIDLTLTTNTSGSGWGAHLNGEQTARGVFAKTMSGASSNRIRGLDNVLVDWLSQFRDPDDWKVSHRIFQKLEKKWGPGHSRSFCIMGDSENEAIQLQIQ